MSTERAADPRAQLARTREEIAQWLKEQPGPLTSDDKDTPASTPASTHVRAGLLLLAIAESILKRSAKLPASASKFPSMQDAIDLVKTITRQHPVWMLSIAMIAGGACAASRPWRWLSHKNTWLGLLSQLAISGVTHIFNHGHSDDESKDG